MSIRISIQGRIVGPDEAAVPILDRGFLFGDSVYETIGTCGGRLFALSEHLERLERSAARIGLRMPEPVAIANEVRRTMAAAGNPETRVRVVLTRGSTLDLDLDPRSASEPLLVVIAAPLDGPSNEMLERGVAVAIVSVLRNSPRAIDPAVKSGNYLNNVLALGEARRSGAYEAVLCAGDGTVAEGASSNIFAVIGGEVRTPPLDVGVLDGITREKVLKLCAGHGIPAAERRIAPDELRTAEEVFITSATRDVLPATTVDGRPIGDGRPGPVTRRLVELYGELRRASVVGNQEVP